MWQHVIDIHSQQPPLTWYLVSLCVLQISWIGSDDTYLLPDLLQKTSSSSPTHNALGLQQRTRELNYSQSPTAPRSPTHQELHVSLFRGMCGQTDTGRQTGLQEHIHTYTVPYCFLLVIYFMPNFYYSHHAGVIFRNNIFNEHIKKGP